MEPFNTFIKKPEGQIAPKEIEIPIKEIPVSIDAPRIAVPALQNPVVSPNCLPLPIVSMLNNRIGDEYNAYYFYRNAANWCKNSNFKKAAAFFEGEASNELIHSVGLQDYLTQWNLIPDIPAAPTRHDFVSLIDIINKAYDIEYNLFIKYSTDQQSLINVHAGTFNFIQKYVDIQTDEVAEYSDLLNALMLINIDNKLDVLFFENTYF